MSVMPAWVSIALAAATSAAAGAKRAANCEAVR